MKISLEIITILSFCKKSINLSLKNTNIEELRLQLKKLIPNPNPNPKKKNLNKKS
jgi:hypothetical protein